MTPSVSSSSVNMCEFPSGSDCGTIFGSLMTHGAQTGLIIAPLVRRGELTDSAFLLLQDDFGTSREHSTDVDDQTGWQNTPKSANLAHTSEPFAATSDNESALYASPSPVPHSGEVPVCAKLKCSVKSNF
jgi:hypothetical protein